MRLPGIGSQYLINALDSKKQYYDGAKTYRVVLLKGIPEANFWSFTLYDNITRSMLDTHKNTQELEVKVILLQLLKLKLMERL
ncbi:DUF1214 domain-containing protein [Flavobacterium panici]|nr:DUF1214 domain-containing protein [Flavobacterium panici]UUF12410.1 DUF1214 domain-containing protein [Flavobacterium panici]